MGDDDFDIAGIVNPEGDTIEIFLTSRVSGDGLVRRYIFIHACPVTGLVPGDLYEIRGLVHVGARQ